MYNTSCFDVCYGRFDSTLVGSLRRSRTHRGGGASHRAGGLRLRFPNRRKLPRDNASAIDSDGKEYKAPLNKLKHDEVVPGPHDESVVTPNVDTLFSYLSIDLRREPVVLGVPEFTGGRYYSIQLIDLYKFTFDYIGTRATGSNAGNYLIVGPNWQGETPADITKVIRSETELGDGNLPYRVARA